MEDGKRLETESGTVQGGLISPVLANVYLHYTLDTWFDYVKKHEFKGEMYMVATQMILFACSNTRMKHESSISF